MGPIACVIIGCLSLCYNVSDSNISIYQDMCVKDEYNASYTSYTYQSSIANTPVPHEPTNLEIKDNIKLPRKLLQETLPKEYYPKDRRNINNTLHRKLLRYDYAE